MGCARNLKLKGGPTRKVARARARKTIFFVCGPNVDHSIQLLCATKRRNGVQGQSPWSGYHGRSLVKLTLLASARSMKAANFIFGNAKSHRCLCCFAKMAFNKSHLGMCIVTRRHLSPSKFLLGQPWEGQG